MDDVILALAQQTLDDFGQNQVPLIGYCQPKVISLSAMSSEIMIPYNAKTQNHLHTLYFGTLAIGADIAGGIIALWLTHYQQLPIELIFKDFKANFHQRAMADTHFHCHDGALIEQMIKEATSTKKRVNQCIHISATTPSISQDTVIASFGVNAIT